MKAIDELILSSPLPPLLIKGGEMKGQIPMKVVDCVKPITLKKKIAYCFEVQTPHRNYHLAADSDEQVSELIRGVIPTRFANSAINPPLR